MRQIKHYILFLLLLLTSASAIAQTAEIKKMRTQVGNLQKEISQKENILLCQYGFHSLAIYTSSCTHPAGFPVPSTSEDPHFRRIYRRQ